MAGIEQLPTGSDKTKMVTSMFDAIAPRYDLVNRVMTFGLDIAWRHQTVRSLGLPNGSLIADIACGTGDLCVALRKAHYMAIGFDLSVGMLTAARTRAPLVLTDATELPVRAGAFDGVTCGFALRNFADLARAFREMARIIRRGGRLALLEVDEPRNPVLRTGHHLYFRKVVPAIGGWLSDKDAYSYLPRSTGYLPDEEGLRLMLAQAGFNGIAKRRLGLGAAQLLTATRG